MHLSRLTTVEMVTLSQGYLDPSHPAHQSMASMPEVLGLLPRLRDAHQILLASQSPDDLRANNLQREITALVAEYDDLAHGIDHLCQGMLLLAEQDEARTRWERLREVLLPGGHKVSHAPYQAEADNAALLEQILNGLPAADKGLLKSQSVGKRSLFEVIERWIAAGKGLGEKELERQAVPVTPTDGALQEARNQWARTVGAIVAMLQMADMLGELPAGIKEHVLGPLRATTERRPPQRTPVDSGSTVLPPQPELQAETSTSS